MNKHLFIEEPKGEFCELKLTYEELTKMYYKIDKLQQELQRKDNIINELKKWLDIKEEKETVGTFSDVLDKIKELEK